MASRSIRTEDRCVSYLQEMGYGERFSINTLRRVCRQTNNDISQAIDCLKRELERNRRHRERGRRSSAYPYCDDAAVDDEQKEEQKTDRPREFQPAIRNLIKCNGDCTSPIGQFIEACFNKESVDALYSKYHATIQDAFMYYGNQLRKKNQRLKYAQYYNDLRDQEYLVQDRVSIERIIHCFQTMAANADKDILQEIANQTCRVPLRNLIEEIREGQSSKLKALQKQYAALQTTLELWNKEQPDDDKTWLAQKCELLQKEMEEEKKKVEKRSDLKSFYKKLKEIKQHPNYTQMEEYHGKDCTLTDLEILAVLFYTDKDEYCYQMRKSHREKESNSCEWKNLFHHLCLAISKLHDVFHHHNKKWSKHCAQFNVVHLLSGVENVATLSEAHRQCVKQQTVTSFSSSDETAKQFAGNHGMVLVIHNGIKALFDGTLKGASVAWMSKYPEEEEFLILPSTFTDFGYLDQRQRRKQGWAHIGAEQHNMYITGDVQSMNVCYASCNLDEHADGVAAWFDTNTSYYQLTTLSVDVFILLFQHTWGHLNRYGCPKCKVVSRWLEFTGKLTDASIECPSCRCYVFRSPSSSEYYREEVKCHNPKCPGSCPNGMIKLNSDLIIIKGQIDKGRQCKVCKQFQKEAYLNAVAYHKPTLHATVQKLLDCMESAIILHYQHTWGKQSNPEYDNYRLEKEKYRADLTRIVRFLYSPQNEHASFDDIMDKFGNILCKWGWDVPVIRRTIVRMCRNGSFNPFGAM